VNADCVASPPTAQCNSDRSKPQLRSGRAFGRPKRHSPGPVKIASDQTKLQQDGSATTADQNAVANAENSQQATALKDQQAIQNAQNAQQASALKTNRPIQNAQNAQQGLRPQDQQAIQNAQNGLASAQNNLQGGQLKDAQSVRSAQQQISTSQLSQQSTSANNAVKQSPPTNATVASDQASVDSAQGQLDTAQTNLNATVLTAPVAGTISTISGAVGTQASGSGSTASSSSTASSTASAGNATSSFITLTDLQSLQVVAGFSETDAAKIQLGQPATVTFNALPTPTAPRQGLVDQRQLPGRLERRYLQRHRVDYECATDLEAMV